MVDAHALLYLPKLCSGAQELNALLNCLTDMVVANHLFFPNLVVKDCADYAKDEVVHIWVKAVAGSRAVKNAPGEWQEEVLSLCSALMDVDDDLEQTQMHVASMGMMLNEQSGVEVAIVTEDTLPLPTRCCLLDACQDLGIKPMRAVDLATCAGAERYLI